MTNIYFETLEKNDSLLGLLPSTLAEYLKDHETVFFSIQTEGQDELLALACFSVSPIDNNIAVLETLICQDDLWDSVSLIQFMDYCESRLRAANMSSIYYRQTGRDEDDVRLGLFLTLGCDFAYVDNDSKQLVFNCNRIEHSPLFSPDGEKLIHNKCIVPYAKADSHKLRVFLAESAENGFKLEGLDEDKNRSLVYEKDGIIIGAARIAITDANTYGVFGHYKLKDITDPMIIPSLFCRMAYDAVTEFGENAKILVFAMNEQYLEGFHGLLGDAEASDDIDEFIKVL